jgi:hypothetical protein
MTFSFHVAWFFAIPVLFGMLIVPLVVWRKYWLQFLATSAAILWFVFAAAMTRNWRADESFTIAYIHEGLPRWNEIRVHMDVHASRLWLIGETSSGHYDDAIPTSESREGALTWARRPLSGSSPPVEWWFRSGFWSRNELGDEHSEGYLALPVWFISLLLLSPAAYWFLTRQGRLRATRARHRLCLHCGYSLLAHAPGQRCPECGNLIAIPLAAKVPEIR